MPEMTFTVRWPDGATEDCYSPSLVMHDHLRAGATYPVAEFAARAGAALDLASTRVQERYGFECSSAAAQKAAIEHRAGRYPAGSEVAVLAMHPPLPVAAAGA